MQEFESEWEFLQNPHEFTDILNTNVNVDIQNILIQRDNQYNISMQLTVMDVTKNDEAKLKKLSTFIFKDNYVLYKVTCSYKKTERYFDYYSGKYIFIYNVYQVERKKTTYSPTRRIDWFLNSVKYRSSKRLFCQNTAYNSEKSRIYINDDKSSIKSYNKIVLNRITISCPGSKFRKMTIRLIDDKFEPFWSNSIAVEYHAIPSEEESEKIHSILNFIMGSYLIKVGSTNLDINNRSISEISYPPEEGFDVRYMCNMPEKSVVLPMILNPYNPELIIKKLSHIINTYLNMEIDLSHTLNLYNQSLISNPNVEIIMLDSALESFAQSMGFEGLAKKKIYSFIYDCGIGSKDGNLISLGEIEDELRTMRNNITHGQLVTDKQKLFSSNLAYRVLYSRVLLKFLKVNKYYDLTTGVIRPIDESIDVKLFNKYQNILRKENYINSRQYYMDLFKLVKK